MLKARTCCLKYTVACVHRTSGPGSSWEGFYCPSAVSDADDVVRSCNNCRMHAPYEHFPTSEVQLIPPIWRLARWGLDIVSPLPKARGNYAFAAVAVKYFTKWTEAKPIINITSATLQKFFWQNIVCRFSVPLELTVDNGSSLTVVGSEDYGASWARSSASP